MEINTKINTGSKYSIQEITSIANQNYQEMLDTGVWQLPNSDTAFRCSDNSNKGCSKNHNKSNRRRGKGQGGGGNNKKTCIKYTPPKPGEPQT